MNGVDNRNDTSQKAQQLALYVLFVSSTPPETKNPRTA